MRLMIDEEQVGEDDGTEAADRGEPQPQGNVHSGPPEDWSGSVERPEVSPVDVDVSSNDIAADR